MCERSLLLYYHERASLAFCQCEVRAVGRDKQAVLVFPQLCLIRTVVLAKFDTVAVQAQCVACYRVDDAPAARELRHLPILCGVAVLKVGKSYSLVLFLIYHIALVASGIKVV